MIGAGLAAIALLIGSSLIGYSAVSQLSGLAVAQSNTQWNNVIDASRGDSQSSGILGQSLYMFNGLSFDRARGDTTNGLDVDVTRMSGAITPADAYVNPTTANQMWSLIGAFNGATWDRIRTLTAGDGAATGILAAGQYLNNGASFDRRRSASATNNTATTLNGVAYTTQAATWSVTNSANAGTPTASRAAGGGTVRHVATALSVCVGAAGTAQPVVQVNLRDGATGAGTIIRSWQLAAPANANACVTENGLNMTGSANTAMTIEFAAATAAATQATVNLSGYSTP